MEMIISSKDKAKKYSHDLPDGARGVKCIEAGVFMLRQGLVEAIGVLSRVAAKVADVVLGRGVNDAHN